jgi:hypothetical protein
MDVAAERTSKNPSCGGSICARAVVSSTAAESAASSRDFNAIVRFSLILVISITSSLLKKLFFRHAAARYMDVPPFSMTARHRKWELLDNRIFRVAMLKKPRMAFSTLC